MREPTESIPRLPKSKAMSERKGSKMERAKKPTRAKYIQNHGTINIIEHSGYGRNTITAD
eukprot:scaffold24946_cov18-Prasinocladus_malaysianus.AAC.1